MSVFHNNILGGAAGSGGAASFQIERSLRFNDDDSAYLNRTPSSAGNRKTWTWSGWLKRGTLGSAQKFFAADDNAGSATYLLLEFQSDDNLRALAGTEGSSATLIKETTMVFRDPSAWYHIVFKFDAANTSAVWYINGEEITDLNTSTNPSNQDYQINATTQHFLGKVGSSVVSDGDHFDGYMAEVHFVDGQALAPTAFGEYDADTGVWNPIQYSGTHGTNGFHLDFSDNTSTTTIGEDSSGNNNDFTANNIVVSSPVYALNTTAASNGTVTNGTNNPYWIDFDPVDADIDYDSHTDGMVRVHDGNTSSTEVYWTGNLGSSGNVKRARFDLRDFPTITSLRVYGGFQSGYVNYQYRLLDSSKTEISGTAGTFGAIGWHSLTITGSPRYLEMSCLHTTSTSTRHRVYGIEVNGTVLVNGNPGDVDSLIDTPTNYEASSGNNGGNYCSLNPLVGVKTTNLTDGNLSQVTSSGWSRLFPTIMPNTGKWYVECFQTNYAYGGRVTNVGVAPVDNINITSASKPGSATDEVAYETQYQRTLVSGAAGQTGFPTYVSNYIIGVAIDFDNRNVQFYLNGSAMGTATTFPSTTKDYTFIIGCTGSTAEAIVNFGQRPFGFPPGTSGGPSSDFKALCTENLSDPTIADPSTAMDTLLYTGNGSTQTITGLDLSPDFLWIKNRSAAFSNVLFDKLRVSDGSGGDVNGASKELYSNLNSAQSNLGYVTLTNDGFTLGVADSSWNAANNYVAWAWDAGSSTVTNTDGTHSAQVRANSTTGFSISTHSRTTAASISTWGHGLNAAPEFAILKPYNGAYNWIVWHKDIGNRKRIFLNSNSAGNSYSFDVWSSSSTTLGIYGNIIAGGGTALDCVTYAWAPVEGYSKFGSYTGNGSTDGTFVYTGFRPAFVMTKRIDSTGSWYIFDSKRDGYNETEPYLHANTSNVEATDLGWDLLSNGFKHRTNYVEQNTSNGSYIYMAWAEHPFKTARAR